MNQSTKKRVVRIFAVCAMLAVVSLCMIGMIGLYRSAERTESPSEESEETHQQTVGQTQGERLNVLVAGQDRSSGLYDVMMLISWDRSAESAWILQIPRDTYAAYTEESYRKLNGAARSLGGLEALGRFLSESLGIPVDRYVGLSPDAFCRAVDAVGGVDVVLEEPFDYEDASQGLSIHLSAGRQHLDGAKAEWFVRFRSGYPRGDLDRLDAQKVFLKAFFERVTNNFSPIALLKLGRSFLSEVQTNLTLADVTSLAGELMRLRTENVTVVTAPGAEAVATASGASYYVLSRAGMDRLLVEHFGGRAGGFDPQSVFLNAAYPHFEEIYRSDVASSPVSMTNVAQEAKGTEKKEGSE